MTQESTPFEPDLSIFNDLIAVFVRRKLTILIVMIGVVVTAYGVVNYMTEQYDSNARLLVMLGRENTEVPVTVQDGGVFTNGIREEEVNSYVQLIKSRSLIEETVDEIGLDRFDFSLPEPETFIQRIKYSAKTFLRGAKQELADFLIVIQLKDDLSDRENIIALIEGALSVQREGASNVIHVAIRLPSDTLARDVLTQHITNYFDRHVSLRNTGSVLQLFDTQTESYRGELDALQQRKAQVRREWELSDVDAQRVELLKRLNELESEADDQRSELAQFEQERGEMATIYDSLPERLIMSETVEPNPAILQLKENLIEKRLDLIDLSGRYRDDFPLLESVQNAIDELDLLLNSEDATQAGEIIYVPHPLRVEFEKGLKNLTVRTAGLRASLGQREAQIENVSSRLERLNEGEDLLMNAELDRSIAEARFLSNNSRLEQAMVSGALDALGIANVVILSAPTAAAKPVTPKKLMIMGISIGAGLMLGFGLALVFEWNDDTIYTSRDLQSISELPFIGEFHLAD